MKNKLVSLIDMVKLSHNPELSEAYIRYLCGLNDEKQYRHQEIKDIKSLLSYIPLPETKLSGFIYGYDVPQLNREFDLLKKYENGQEKNEFFNSFINRVILYDDKILIFYNTDDNHPTVIKRKNTEELISQLNDIASNGKTATNDCPNTTGNNGPSIQKENSLEPQGFKRVSLGGEAGI